MAAVSAVRHNPDLGRKYRELIAAASRRRLPWSPSCASSCCSPTPRSGRIASGRRAPATSRPGSARRGREVSASDARTLRRLPVVTCRWPPAPVANLTPESAQENLATEPRACMHVQLRSNACNTDTHLPLGSLGSWAVPFVATPRLCRIVYAKRCPRTNVNPCAPSVASGASQLPAMWWRVATRESAASRICWQRLPPRWFRTTEPWKQP